MDTTIESTNPPQGAMVADPLNFSAATATIVRRRRTGIPALEFTPEAQESDPTRR